MIKCCWLCKSRHENCHAVCSLYIEESRKSREESLKQREYMLANSFHIYDAPGQVADNNKHTKKKLNYYTRGRKA